MARVATGISGSLDLERGVEEACAQALEGTGGSCDAALVLIAAAHGRLPPGLPGRTRRALGTPDHVGTHASSLIVEGTELDRNPAVAVLALRGLRVRPVLVDHLAGHEERVADELPAPRNAAEAIAVLLPPANELHLPALVRGLGEVPERLRVVGASVAGPAETAAQQWSGDGFATSSLCGLIFEGRSTLCVSPGCAALAPPQPVTRARGNWVLGVDGRTGLELMREFMGVELRGQRELAGAARNLVVARLAAGADATHALARARNVVGFDEARGAFALPEPVSSGEQLILARRDPVAAREALTRSLAQAGAAALACELGLYLGCAARGTSGSAATLGELDALAATLRGAPLFGLRGAAQIASLGGRAELLSHAGVLAVLSGSG